MRVVDLKHITNNKGPQVLPHKVMGQKCMICYQLDVYNIQYILTYIQTYTQRRVGYVASVSSA